jgi:hypothetical protein
MAARAKMKVRIRALHRMSAKLALVENFESTPSLHLAMAQKWLVVNLFLSARGFGGQF